MPHKGAVHTLSAAADADATEAQGADILLSLSSDSTPHVHKALQTPDGKGFFPLSKEVTPSELDRRRPMLMSIHSTERHRILPSPITMEQGSWLVYGTHEEHALEKRQADSPPSDAEQRPRKRHAPENEVPPEPQEPREGEEAPLISPTTSHEEGKKTEAGPPPPPPPPPASYYPHPPQPYAAAAYPPYPPSWGTAPPAPPMGHAYYFPHHHHHHHHHPPPPSYHYHPMVPPPQRTAAPQPYQRTPPRPKQDGLTTKHAEAQSEAIQSIRDWQKAGGRSYARCIPLPHPIPSRYWGETNKDVHRKLPDFPRLVNFPDYLSRGQTRTGGDGGTPNAEGKRHCVMCGKLRLCSKSAQRGNKTKTADDDNNIHIIPRQNKGVCTACDVAVWVMVAQDGLEIKWCKGCKNFKPWAAFGEKGLATKCVRCRHRQREKYASQKLHAQQEDKDDILAAQGLSTLMGAEKA